MIPEGQVIFREVSKAFGVEESELQGKLRLQALAEARFAAMYFCRQYTPLTLAEVGELFGGRNHATIINGVRRFLDLKSVDADYRYRVKNLEAVLRQTLAAKDWRWGESRLLPGEYGYVWQGELGGEG